MNWRTLLAATATFGSVFVLGPTPAHAVSGDTLYAALFGGNEVSPAGLANAGDLDGIGSATVLIRGTTLCFGITVVGIATPTAAHIHRGSAGTNGAILVSLSAPAAGNPGTSSGCVNITAALANELRLTPNGFYVNVHTTAFMGGALRGQLF